MKTKPVVAIIGRPNVGKSTLFNRISGKQKAIVIDEPGATRDRNYMDCVYRNKAFILIDTGGFEPASEEEMLVQMREQTHLAIEEADVIIFLMDGRDGLTASDIEISRHLRGKNKKIVYVANKVDGERHEGMLTDFYRLGIDEIHPISARHGLGLDELLEVIVRDFPDAAADTKEKSEHIRIAMIGRPNVGKSSLVNKILGRERSIAHFAPGTTRDAVDSTVQVYGKTYLLIDTAGIRRKSKISQTLEKYSVVQAIQSIHRCDIALVLMDAEEGVTEQDVKIAGLVYEQGKACILVVNKWDKVAKDNSTVGQYVDEIKHKIKFMDFAPIVFISAVTGQRVPKIFEGINQVYAQYIQRVGTAPLNALIKKSVQKNPPPRYQNKPVQIFYATQTDVKPPTFVFFVSRVRGIHFSYERYLINQIREAFGFDHVPLKIIFRKKRPLSRSAC
jgi:GTP-binding protein